VDIWRADFAPLLLAVLAYSAAEQLGPRHATSDFYVVAAQIIPLLLLAIALEARLLSVGFPDIDALIADVEKAQEPLGEIEKEVDRLADEAPEQVAEWRKKIADQREHTGRELDRLRQRITRARPGVRRYRSLMRLYAGLTAARTAENRAHAERHLDGDRSRVEIRTGSVRSRVHGQGHGQRLQTQERKRDDHAHLHDSRQRQLQRPGHVVEPAAGASQWCRR
jgi:hypothetical protein